jgi:DnaD/phage-associated family protein
MTDQKSNHRSPARPRASQAGAGSTPAFVKVFTNFKEMLPSIDANALKVWLFIALSINRESAQAHPGIRTIARGCGLDKDTITRAVKRLEGSGLLKVERQNRRYNLYAVPAYVSANSRQETVPEQGKTLLEMRTTGFDQGITFPTMGTTKSDGGKTVPCTGTIPAEPVPTAGTAGETVPSTGTTPAETVPTAGTAGETVPIDPASVPIPGETVPASWGLNQINQIQPESTTTTGAAAIFKSYESEIGLITPKIRDTLNNYLDVLKLPPEWIIEAIELAAAHNKRNWAYCAAILKRWAAEGKTALPPRHKPPGLRGAESGDYSEFFKQLERA